MSVNAMTRASSYTTVEGIACSTILQNRQSAMAHNLSAMRTICFVALTVVALALPARAADPRAPFDVHTNLTYYSGEGADKYRHRLDLYVPKAGKDVRKDFPVMMFVHGGGFTVGIK